MIKLKIQFFILSLIFNTAIYSATYTTTAVAGVWSPAGSPVTGDNLIINHNWSAYNFTFSDNTVNPTSNGDITVNNGGALKVNSALTISGNTNLIVEATGTFITTGSFVVNGAAGTKRFDGYINNAGAVLNGANITGIGTWEFAGSFANNGSINGFTAHPSFSPFSIANPNNPPTPLPVKLLNFELEYKNNKIYINWSTLYEINNDYFILYKRNYYNEFEPIAIIQGNGNSTVKINYEFIDEESNSGWNEYQIKQVDLDGRFEYFPIKGIYLNPFVKVYPNPVKENINIELEKDNYLIDYPIYIYNLNGEIVYNTVVKSSFNTVNLSLLKNGLYTLTINGLAYKFIVDK
jgi:hypothetical protein